MRIKNYLSLVKFSHTIFAMPFAAIGFVWALHDVQPDSFPYKILISVILCMVFARNAAMGFNRYIDRKFDAENERTAERDIPAGKISPKSALIFVIVNCILFCISASTINRLTLILSPVALLVVLGYSYTKRYTWLCHFILGLGLAIAPVAAYIAVSGKISGVSLFISAIVLFWVGGFDILYALPDENFDKQKGLKSVPVLLGRRNAMILSALVHLVTAVIIFSVGIIFGRGVYYYTGATIFTLLLIYQHIIVTPSNLSRLNAAFFTTNGIASVCYALFTIIDLYAK